MRGNKFYTKLCLVIIAILCFGVVGAFYFTPAGIYDVQAEDTTLYEHEKCSQKYDDGVVFSVEQVYFYTGSTTVDGETVYNRTIPLYYTASGTTTDLIPTNILGYGDTVYSNNYYLNYSGLGEADDSLNKKIIKSGEYALLNEKITQKVYKQDGTQVSLSQGIMISLGSLVFNGNTLYTNSTENPSGTLTNPNYSSMLQNINIEMKRNGKVFTSTETSGTASLRTYNQGTYLDFVYFLDASATNEGFYEISFSYIKEGGQTQTHSFNFFILLNSKYDNSVNVNSQEYTMAPHFSNVEENSSSSFWSTIKGIDNQYPVLTYDYKHYDMKYTYIHNDLVTNVEVVYEENLNEGIDRLAINSTTNGDTLTTYYSCRDFADNDFVSFIFANVGTYNFEFNYVFYYNNERLVVDNLNIENKTLNIYGYELKYAKTGFSSSDLRYLEIVRNGTLVVPVNGYENSSVVANASQELGYMYKIVNPAAGESSRKKSGDIVKLETADITDNVDTIFNVGTKVFTEDVKGFTYVETDQGGLWFNLNDEYNLIDSDSYYLYSSTAFTEDKAYTQRTMEKVTTFTQTGYYFVYVGYKYKNYSNVTVQDDQYFAFKICSGVANIKLYTTEDTIPTDPTQDINRLYSNQYTNKNVYATWEEPTTFVSSQTATLYYVKQGYDVYESKTSLMKYAMGGVNISLTSSEYKNRETLITSNGSYLLEVKVDGSDTKAYYYFTIDKEDISGLDVLAISSATVGSNTIYNVAKDAENNAITYTSKLVIDEKFTFWWNDKKSGAQITGTYTYTPIIYSVANGQEISGTDGDGNEYLWLLNNYKLGTTSQNISIEKPSTKTSTVDPNNVLTNQGVYWFYLKDEAGNEMNYMVIIDKTEALIKATTQNGSPVISGEMIAEGVELEWGTHKVLELSEDIYAMASNSVVNKIYSRLFGFSTEKYYEDSATSNVSIIEKYLKTYTAGTANKLFLVVENTKATINNTTINSGDTYIKHSEISLIDGKWHNVSIGLNDTATTYLIKVFGENQVQVKDSNSKFTVVLNPDKSEGKINSKADDTENVYKWVNSYNDDYREDDEEDKAKFDNNYNLGQATNDGLFVFDWANNDGTEYEVARVTYEYLPLLSQDILDTYDAASSKFKYYPYDYDSKKDFIIYDSDKNINNYETYDDGTKTRSRSTVLNAGYVLYYEGNKLVSRNATLPGMYIITREYANDIEIKNDNGQTTDSKVRKYVFFVDRNNIIDYSPTSVSDKTVGNHIDLYLQEFLAFEKFTRKFTSSGYDVHLSTNRLPMQIRVPTGKYASKISDEIVKTSYSKSGKIDFVLTFYDSNNFLGYNNGTDVFRLDLFNSSEFISSDNGYIDFKLVQEKLLYYGQEAYILQYLSACTEVGSDWLSLPGVYTIKISDNVGSELDEQNGYEIVQTNNYTITVEVVKSNPTVNIFANQVPSNEDSADIVSCTDGSEFSTSKAYVRYKLNAFDDASYNAQVDTSYIYITRTEDGVNYKEYYNSKDLSNSEINDTVQAPEGHYYIQADEFGNKIIWLETGVQLDEDGNIIDYKEYTYKISVRYILKNTINDNDYTKCYIYNVVNGLGVPVIENAYESLITVNIDRTPAMENLINSVAGQEIFLEEYINAYGDENFTISGKLDSKIYNTMAFRDFYGQDYYAIVNSLYYYYINQGDYSSAENAMYAIKVNEKDSVTIEKNGSMYYRKLYYDKSGNPYIDEDRQRMALLPICKQHSSNVTDFETFSKNSTGHFNTVNSISSDKTWYSYLKLGSSSGEGYGYYEIIELDASGNMTQYIIYVENGANENQPVNLIFEDVTCSYAVNLNFAEKQINIVSSANVEDNIIDEFALIVFDNVTDMFGLTVNRRQDLDTDVDFKKDWFYKVSIVNKLNNQEVTHYLNYNNNRLAEYIYNVFSEDKNQNYALTLTDRYNNALTLNINILIEEYSLSVSRLKAKQGVNVWYIDPSDLNSDIGTAWFYVDTIELLDLSAATPSVVKFDLDLSQDADKKGKVFVKSIYVDGVKLDSDTYKADINDVNNYTVTTKGDFTIQLAPDREYQVKLVDCARKEIGPYRIYSYVGGDTTFSIKEYGECKATNDIYYSANPIEVTYNSNVYSDIVLKVSKDGNMISIVNLDTISNLYVNYNILVDVVKNDKNISLKFNPYTIGTDIKDVGACLEFELNLLFDNKTEQTIKMVLDNRIPTITLLNRSGEDKTNIMKIQYVYSDTYSEDKTKNKLVLDTNKLFEYAPALTISETVVLGWEDFDSTIYTNGITNYYHPYLYLIEYKTKNNWFVTNLTTSIDTIKHISPNKDSLGRYVLIYALHSSEVSISTGNNADLISDNLISYKAYAFNISSTANAMYEVQDSNGQVKDYDSLISAQQLLYVIRELEVKNSFLIALGFEINGVEFQKFINQTSIPLYISIDSYSLVPNGDNGIEAKSFDCEISSDYKLSIFKVTSKVHTTYVCILKVEPTDELVNTETSVSEIRFISEIDNIPTSLINVNTITFHTYGSLYFTSFNQGSVPDSGEGNEYLHRLNIAKHNKLYLEVWYKYNDDKDGVVKVGDFFGENGKNDDSFIKFKTSGTYIIYLKDIAGNTREWTSENGMTRKFLTITIMPEVLVAVNNEVPVEYNYYNGEVTVAVLFAGAGYYDNGSIRIKASFNGGKDDYIERTNVMSYTFTEYGTYRVTVEAEVNDTLITKTLVFSIINPYEARLALDFTQISKYNITKVLNSTTNVDVTSKFNQLLNEGYIYNKLITYERLSKENIFGSTMGKQTFKVYYSVNTDGLVPTRECSFEFTVNNQTPSLQSSIAPGESTTKNITIKFNAQTIYRQVGDCYIVVNGEKLLSINNETAFDGTTTITLDGVGDYYVKVESDSGRVITSFKVTIKEPLNTMSIILIVAAVLVVVGLIVTFIVLRTKMKVR